MCVFVCVPMPKRTFLRRKKCRLRSLSSNSMVVSMVFWCTRSFDRSFVRMQIAIYHDAYTIIWRCSILRHAFLLGLVISFDFVSYWNAIKLFKGNLSVNLLLRYVTFLFLCCYCRCCCCCCCDCFFHSDENVTWCDASVFDCRF